MAALAPVIFFGHGSPMMTLSGNKYTDAWAEIGHTLSRPKAILSVSAHWYTRGAAVTVSTAPQTIHDFGGFPKALFEIQYPAPGSPALAARVQQLLAPLPVERSDAWGLDHGTWTVLRHVYPNADVPVVQLSIDGARPAAYHYEVGQRLAPLREEGILIVGSGNIVHNLRTFVRDQPELEPFDWARTFDARARELLLARDFEALIRYERLGREAPLAIPTPDHYLPLLYVLGASTARDALSFPVEGIDGGSMSMRAVRLG